MRKHSITVLSLIGAALLAAAPALAATKKPLPAKGGPKHPEWAQACAAKWPAYLAGLLRAADDADETMTPAEIKTMQTGYTDYCLRAGPDNEVINFFVEY